MVKKTYKKCIVVAVLLLFTSPNVQAQGFLHTSGTQIVNGEGERVLLRGIGLGGWMLQEPYMLKLADVATTQLEIRAMIEDLVGEKRPKSFTICGISMGCKSRM